MNNQNDPISQIKTAEADSQQSTEKKKKNLEEALHFYSEETDKKTTEFERELKEKGTEILGNVKREASELFKSSMSTSEREKNKIITEAKKKKGEAVKEIIADLLSYLKS